MNPIADEWITLAEEDYGMAITLSEKVGAHYYRGICTHVQQSAEKYLKGFLVQNNTPYKWTHNLEILLADIVKIQPDFELIRREVEFINEFGPDIRYPGDPISEEEAVLALKGIVAVRKFVRNQMGLPDEPE